MKTDSSNSGHQLEIGRPALWGIFGGKHRIRYEVAEFINAICPRVYLEPFCGLAWVGEQIRAQKRIFSDLNLDVILMFKALKQGWIPPTKISEEEYAGIRKDKTPSALRGFAGTHCSFGGLFLNTYARSADGTNFAAAGSRTMRRRISTMRHNSYFIRADYMKAIAAVPDADLIYLDPPYAGTTQYTVGAFNHEEFWNNIRRMTDESRGKKRFLISEYSAPEDFTVVMETTSRMGLSTGSASAGGLHKAIRREILVEYRPVKLRKRVFFDDLFPSEKKV